MTTLAEHINVAGAENRPLMLKKSMYDSWASLICLFIKGKKNDRIMLDLIDNGLLVYPTVEENTQTRPKKYSELTEAQQLQDDCDVQATNIILHGIPPNVYALVNHQEAAKDIWDRDDNAASSSQYQVSECSYQNRASLSLIYLNPLALVANSQTQYNPSQSPQHSVNPQQQSVSPKPFIFSLVTQQSQAEFPQLDSGLAVPTFYQGEDLIDCINKAMTFLSVVASRFPPSNNQLRTSSNSKNQATIQDGRVIVQQASGQEKVVKCYNCLGEGHIAKQCTQPKRTRSSAWFKEKLMLAEVQEAGQILDEEQLAFIADPVITEVQVAQQTILQNSAFQTKDLDAYDSDCNNISSAKAILMENLSSCDSNVLFEVPYFDTYLNDMINQDVQEIPAIAKEHDVISMIDDEETLILEEESQSKMLDKQNDPILIKQKINISPIDYSKLNKIKEDFGKRFVTQKELSAEQAFWLKHSNYNPDTSVKSHTPVRIEAPSELPKVSLVNESLKKLKYQLASFDKVVKKRTTSDAITADKNAFEIQIKKLSIDNDQLLKQIMSQEIMHIAVNSMDILNVTNSCVDECNNCLEIKTKELLVYVSKTCPSLTKPCEKLVVVTPMNKDKKVRFVEPVTSSSNIPKQTDSLRTKDSNKPLLTSTGVNTTTSASGSKPSGNTKKNRISRPPSSNQKNKVEEHPRKVKSSLNKTNSVSEPISNAHVKHSVRNAKFESICAICNKCLFDANHDMCVIDYVNDVNVRSKSKSKRNKMRKVWKPTGKVFNEIGYSWKPTGRTFTIVGNKCPLTRFTSTKVVPTKETTNKSVLTPTQGIIVVQIVLWYLDSGCSKHMTGNRSQLINFVSKFLGTVRFGNDHIAKIMVMETIKWEML
ncbi:retrovirus-related pol polyprotein from transposon TNT 1-94 [Tanacetum coccineum]